MRPSALYRSARLAFVGFALIFFGLPFYWAAVLAFSDPSRPRVPSWSMFYPQGLSTSSFEVLSLLDEPIENSLIVAGATAVASTVLAVSAGYALSRMRFGRGVILVTLLVLRILPPVTIMIPVFILAVRFHLRDSLVGLILIYTALSLPFSMWFIYLAMRALPVEIEEAAMIDGCTRRQAALLMARLALPGILAAAIFAFVLAWAEFTIALILTATSATTLPVALNFSAVPSEDPFVGVLVLVGAVPGLVLALLIQRSLKSGSIIGTVDR
jgi:multiple sugar transport system permease protein